MRSVLPVRGDQPAIFANGSLCLGEEYRRSGRSARGLYGTQELAERHRARNRSTASPAQRLPELCTVWAQNIRDEEIARLTKLDVHSLGQWSVDATLRNLQDFFDAFNITDGKMYMHPVEERVII